jgi:uncharacterized protein (DUF58 family)
MSEGERAVLEACRRYKLVRNLRRTLGSLGSELGRRAGASVEFHDFRPYFPGDDPRRIDWAVYGRSGELTVRLYREEVHPRVDVLLDTSRSMAVADGRKAELARELAAFACQSARLSGSSARLYAAGEALREHEHALDVPLDARGCTLFEQPAACARRLRPAGLRVLISDCLSPHAPELAIRELSYGTAQLAVLMTLGPWEARPDAAGALTLADSESQAELTAQLSGAGIERYLARLRELRARVEAACHAVGAAFAEVVCDGALLDALRRDLLPRAIVCPA